MTPKPILFDNVRFPKDDHEFPEPLKFIFSMNKILLPADTERFKISPFNNIKKELLALPERGEIYRDIFNSNTQYDVNADYWKKLEAAKSGDVNAIYQLALNYYYGFTDENGESSRNFPEAYKCFLSLTKTDNPHKKFAINMIGHMFYSGTVPFEDQDYKKSLEHHLDVADSIENAANHAAYMLSIGSGCEFNYDKTISFYEKLIENGDTNVKYNLAQFYCEYGEYSKAAELYHNIYSFMPEAATQLGKLYKRGVLQKPPKPDYSMAAFLFQYAIGVGNCGAEPYYELGRLYFNPTGGFPKNFKMAQENFLIAAEMGHVDSQYMLGYMYDAGHVEQNIEKAIHYYELAVAQGHMLSAAALATLYQQPEHINYHRAFKYAKMAATSGVSMGEFIYANLLFFGRGCNADMNKAYKYYKRSYEHGFVQSKIMMDKIDEINKKERNL